MSIFLSFWVLYQFFKLCGSFFNLCWLSLSGLTSCIVVLSWANYIFISCLLVAIIIVIVIVHYLVWKLFKQLFLLYHLINSSKIWAVQEMIYFLMNHILISNHALRFICIRLFKVMFRLSTFYRLYYTKKTGIYYIKKAKLLLYTENLVRSVLYTIQERLSKSWDLYHKRKTL